VEEFNSKLKLLVVSLVKLYPADSKIRNAKNKIFLAINFSPVQVLEKTGKNLFKYKDHIYDFNDGSEDFFMGNSFEEDVAATSDGDAEKTELAEYIIPKLKECAKTMTTENKQKYKQIVVDMLDTYINFMTL
jgi:hypothetical protein